MKGSMKAGSSSSAMWKGWKEIGLLRVYVRECTGSHAVGRPRNIWIDTMKECFKKRGLDVRQGRRMVQDWSEWKGFVRRNAWGIAHGMNP